MRLVASRYTHARLSLCTRFHHQKVSCMQSLNLESVYLDARLTFHIFALGRSVQDPRGGTLSPGLCPRPGNRKCESYHTTFWGTIPRPTIPYPREGGYRAVEAGVPGQRLHPAHQVHQERETIRFTFDGETGLGRDGAMISRDGGASPSRCVELTSSASRAA